MKLKISELEALIPLGVIDINTEENEDEDDIQVDAVPVQLAINPIGED